MISAIFPAYNEEHNVKDLHTHLLAALRTIGEPFEIIAVDNGSTDKTLEQLRLLSPLRVLSIAANIGQSAGLDAGIHAARGDLIVTLDADLQNDPQDIARMFEKIKEGYDAVVGWRQVRHDTFGRRFSSRLANALARFVLGVNVHDYGCALKIFKKQFLQGIRLYGEMHIYLAAILALRGARLVEVPVRHHERTRDATKHSFFIGLKNLTDLFTVKFLTRTVRPLLIFGSIGLGSFGVGSLATLGAVILKLYALRNFGQTPLPIIASFCITIGILFIMIGFLAEFILRIFYEGRNETPYIIRSVSEK